MNSNDVKQIFEDNLKEQSWWARLFGSQFSVGLINFMSQVIYRCISVMQRDLNEVHLSQAVRAPSILAAAENKGYVRAKITPSTGTLSVNNPTGSTVFIPANTELESQAGLTYVVVEGVNIASSETKLIAIKQLKKKRLSTVVSVEENHLEVVLSKEDSSKVNLVDVHVETNEGSSQWKQSFLFRGGDSKAKIYMEFYTSQEKLGVRFGNGVVGKRPPANSTVHLDLWLTDGETELIEGQKLSFVNNAFVQLTATTSTAIVGGLPQESIEDVRQGALYAASYNEEVVWGNDYRTFILTKIPQLDWLSVWGEQEQEKESGASVLNTNKIFICAFSDVFTNEQIEEQITALFSTIDLFNLEIQFVPVNFVSIPITLNALIEPIGSIADSKASIINLIDNEYGKNAENRTDSEGKVIEIKSKDLWVFIDQTELFTDFDLQVTLLSGARNLADYRYIDTATSTINVSRENV
ncbi:hypothetical protein KO527_05450 [Pseudoalteromonas sp. C2R02]|uniref:hypothetical protein n=1 Tax=Pseudoalteromonas sp. C2R02 TaxID=2841565 RepID=UPI001C091F24|nr:hypothetical protein [Pseudoalteromonas sp. C2R02]MBU2968794.1 hypothetical protein [Pseudoalteromonas sp. C2R02]